MSLLTLVAEHHNRDQIAMFDGASFGVLMLERTGVLRYANPAALSMLWDDDFPLQDYAWPPSNATKLTESDGASLSYETWPLRLACTTGKPYQSDVTLLAGAFRKQLHMDFWPGKDQFGCPIVIGTITDVTAQRKLEHRLVLAKAAIDSCDQAIIITDPQSLILDVNPSFEQITGYAASEVIGKPSILLRDNNPDFDADLRSSLLSNGFWRGQIWHPTKNKGPFRAQLSIVAVGQQLDGVAREHIAFFSEQTDQQIAEERIEFLANFDLLTQLPNRRMLECLLDRMLLDAEARKGRLAVLFIDLDNFKFINDSLGHQIGDKLLFEVAKRLRLNVRKSDVVARHGGDEFIILASINDGQEASLIAEKLVAAMDRAIVVGDHRLRVAASVGVCIYPNDAVSRDDLVKNAEAAMYEAKRGGRGQHAFYSPTRNAEAVSFARLAGRLHSALMKDLFEVHYQPKIDALSHKVIGLEALIRARDPELGGPVSFIPVAEKAGLIAELGELVTVHVCRQIRRWLDQGFSPPRVAINASAVQLRNGILIRALEEATAFARIPYSALEIELTETSLMEHFDEALETLNWLHAHEIPVAIDDFGTGYSSLAYLQKLPIDILKIDRAFVRELDSSSNGVVARAIVGLAKSLSLKVVAEGVETIEQVDKLTLMGCDQLQGYYFGAPVAANKVPELCAWTVDESKIINSIC